MYSVILTTMLTTQTVTPEFGRLFNGRGCAGCYGCYGGSGGCIGSYAAPAAAYCECPPAVSHGHMNGFGGLPMDFSGPHGVAGEPGLPAHGFGESVVMPPAGIPAAPGGIESLPPPVAPGVTESVTSPDRATVVVTMPADGQLLINGEDGQKLGLAGPVRVFRTPPLEPGKQHFYDLLMVVQRGGMREEVKEEVKLEAGKVTNVKFDEPRRTTPTSSARISVRLPDGATLTVEGRAVVLPAARPVFRTPPLENGRTYFYTLTADVVRDGRTENLTREVAFRAGQDVAVDFTETAQTTKRWI